MTKETKPRTKKRAVRKKKRVELTAVSVRIEIVAEISLANFSEDDITAALDELRAYGDITTEKRTYIGEPV